MRTLFTLVVILLSTTITNAGGNSSKISDNLTVGGRFLEKRFVNYEVYEKDSSGSQVILKNWGIKNFNVELELHKSYVIKFISRKGEVKYLTIDASSIGGTLIVDVDFGTSKSAKLVRTQYGGYRVVPLDNEQTKLLAMRTSEE